MRNTPSVEKLLIKKAFCDKEIGFQWEKKWHVNIC